MVLVLLVVCGGFCVSCHNHWEQDKLEFEYCSMIGGRDVLRCLVLRDIVMMLELSNKQ